MNSKIGAASEKRVPEQSSYINDGRMSPYLSFSMKAEYYGCKISIQLRECCNTVFRAVPWESAFTKHLETSRERIWTMIRPDAFQGEDD